MSANVNYKKLLEQSDELYRLIHATNSILEDPEPISELRVNLESKVSNLAPKLTNAAKALVVTRGTKETLIVAAVVAGAAAVGWVGAAGIDGVRNGIAKNKAKKALLGYYQQLASKQSMIIAEQQRINVELAETMEDLQENEEQNREKIRILQKKQAELAQLLFRFDNLKQQVEK